MTASHPGPRPAPPARPAARRDLLVRSRLVSLLLERWERRVVQVVAGAGFGKTTLLAQAIEENRLAPRGVDVWVPCGRAQSSAAALAEVVAAGLDVELDPEGGDVAAAAIEALWKVAPDPVALVVDDVQDLEPGSSAAELLARLVADAPEHVHFVLAGRSVAPVPLARLRAQGSVVALGEDELLFDDAELKSVADLRGGGDLGATGGWPALVELKLSVGDGATSDFLWEEVLARLDERQRRVLRALAVVGGADDALASELLGEPVDLPATLGSVPMVAADEASWHTVHALWGPALGTLGAPEAEGALRARAAARAQADGDLTRAWSILAGGGQWDAAERLLGDVCAEVNPGVVPDVLGAWVAELPGERQGSGTALLARGLAELDRDAARSMDLLEQARAAFEAAGDVERELLTVAHLASAAFHRGDLGAASPLLQRVVAMCEAGHEAAAPFRDFGRVVFADLVGDHAALRELLDAVPLRAFTGSLGAMVTRYRAQSELLFGSLAEARRWATVAVDMSEPAFRPTAATMLLWGTWLDGRIDEALDLVPAIQPPERGSTRRHDVGAAANTALVHALLGHLDEAQAVLEAHADDLDTTDVVVSRVVGSLARAARLVGVGDEVAAADLLESEIAARPLAGRPTTGHVRCLALTWVLVPATRAHWRSLPLGEGPGTGRRLAEQLVAVRADGARAMGGFDWPAPDVVRSHLPAAWSVELAVAGLAAGAGDPATALLDAVGPEGRPALRRLSRHADKGLAKAARAALAAAPTPPSSRLSLGLLGPVRLLRDGVAVDSPDWRRERVRALLAELVTRRRASREELAAALWPDLEPEAAANNLRVTLSYLLRVLEPDRAEAEPSWFVRADRTVVVLEPGDALGVDVWDFERALDEARRLEAAGTPSLAVEPYLRACAAYRGDLLVGVEVDAAGELRRERLRSLFVSGAVRAGELATARGDHRTALELAERALAVDPWCEAAYRVAGAAHLASGDRTSAQRALEAVLARCDELDVHPDGRTVMLARRLDLDV